VRKAEGEVKRTRVAGVALAVGFVVAAVGCLALGHVASRSPSSSRAALEARVRALPCNVADRLTLARLDLAAGRPRAARARLASSLRSAPFSADLWLARAEAALHAGRPREARRASRAAVALAPTSGFACYRAALVLLQIGDGVATDPPLRCALENDPGSASAVLDLAHAVYADDAVVLDALVPPDAQSQRGFLAWAYSRGSAEAARRGWEALAAIGASAADRLRHIDFLLSQGEVDAAAALWTAGYGPRGPGLVFDGDFEGDPVGAGFGWAFRGVEGARIAIAGGPAAARGARGLAIEFAGGNLDFAHVSQIVPVAGGRRYQLSALVRADGITSLSGPRLAVLPYAGCEGFQPVYGPELLGTRPWSPSDVDFTTPPGCRAVMVLVRRAPTTRLDHDLRGRLYLDDVKLTDADDASATESASAATSRSRNTSPGM